MKAEKDSKYRLTPEMGAAVERLMPMIEQSPELRAKLEYGGRITKSAVIREAIGRGFADLVAELRKSQIHPEPVAKPTPTKPTHKRKPTRKPAKRKAK